MLPTHFTNLLMALQYRKNYQRALLMGKQKLNLRQHNIEDLTPLKTLELYRGVIKKFYISRNDITQESWFQNQLRIFLWLLIGYLFLHRKSIQQMNHDDWSYFTPIFHNRPSISFEYQGLCLIPHSRSGKWDFDEIQLLRSIIKQNHFTNKWNSIARELFIRSERTFYRSPKQCRERWLNYLDPNKKKSGWDKDEDLLLLKTINQLGYRWSTAVKILNNTRTQHAVKNRYKSLVSYEIKFHKLTQQDAVIKLIEKLQNKISYSSSSQNHQQSLFMNETNNFEDQFLMDNQDIDDFLRIDFQKDNRSQQDNIMEQKQLHQQKINYFSEEYHPCFP